MSKFISPAAAILFSACAQLATVKNVEPVPPAAGTASGFPTEKEAHQDPETALARNVDIASQAWNELKRNPSDSGAVQRYNYSVARIVWLLEATGKPQRTGAVTIGTRANAYEVTFASDSKVFADPENCHFVPADELAISGKDYHQRVRRNGIGAPVLAELDTPLENARAQFLTSDKIYYSMTAVLDFQGAQARLIMKDPLASDTVSIAGHNHPLAADFSIGIAAVLAKDRPQRLGFIRMIRPGRYAATARLVRAQPYDPNKIPVLMTHGLQDTPATWAPLLNQLRSDPEINKHYQFWVFSYPSGYPFQYSAELLREELDRVDKTYPGHKKIVLIGHSMGGLVSRLMVTDSGMSFWDTYFGKSPDQVPMNPKDKQLVESVLIFSHRPDISRVIFCSTPHRGAGLATNWVGRIGIAISRLPVTMLSLGVSAEKYVIVPGNSARKPHFPTSIGTLAPTNPFVRTLNTLPIADHIPYNSIIGDRGRGDTPNSSDGVVPYWSFSPRWRTIRKNCSLRPRLAPEHARHGRNRTDLKDEPPLKLLAALTKHEAAVGAPDIFIYAILAERKEDLLFILHGYARRSILVSVRLLIFLLPNGGCAVTDFQLGAASESSRGNVLPSNSSQTMSRGGFTVAPGQSSRRKTRDLCSNRSGEPRFPLCVGPVEA